MKEALKSLLIEAHQRCCERNNVSSFCLIQGFHGSGFVPQAIASAVSTFGDLHAPVHHSIHFFLNDDWEKIALGNIRNGNRLPGWGSDFIKGEPDPVFTELDRYMAGNCVEFHDRIHTISQMLWDEKKTDLYPNAAAYTAAVGAKLGYTSTDIHFLLLECRLPAWRQHILDYERGSINLSTPDKTAESKE